MRKNTASSAINRLLGTRLRWCLVGFIVVGIWIFSERAKAQIRDGKSLVSAEIIASASGTDEAFTAGIRFSIQPEWYLYWKNPGDAGLPIEVTWKLPEGWKAGAVRFPIPSKFAHEGITAYGYKNEVVLLTTITPKEGSIGEIKAQLDWLVCRESCLRSGAEVSFNISQMTARKRKEAENILASARSKLPGTQKESRVFFQRPQLLHNEEQWTLVVTLTGSGASKVIDFFPEMTDGILVKFDDISIHQNQLKIGFIREDLSIQDLKLRGLLVTDNSAYASEIPIQFLSQ